MEKEDLLTGTFVPIGSRKSLGLNSATAETCGAGMYSSEKEVFQS
jgi:hypothetical protein